MCGIFCGAARGDETRVPRWVWRRNCQNFSTGLNAGKEDGGWRRRRVPGTRGFSPVWGHPAPSGSKSSTSSDGVTALRRLAADHFATQVHGLGVGIRQDHGRADIAAWPPSAAYGGPFAALIARGGEPAAARPRRESFVTLWFSTQANRASAHAAFFMDSLCERIERGDHGEESLIRKKSRSTIGHPQIEGSRPPDRIVALVEPLLGGLSPEPMQFADQRPGGIEFRGGRKRL
jgi:hypothetical protein